MLNNPNSCPFKGRIPIKPAVAPTPKNDDKITDPHDAHPTPIIPRINPEVPIPASLLNLAARRIKYTNKLIFIEKRKTTMKVIALDKGVKFVWKEPKILEIIPIF